MSDELVKRLQDQQTKWMTPLLGQAADRIAALEAALAKADDLADAVHMMTDRGVIWRDETEREFQAPIKTYEDALDTLTAYRQSRDATR